MELHRYKVDKSFFDLEKIKELYESAFPEDERPPFAFMLNESLNGVRFYAYYDNDEFIGLAYLVEYLNNIYLYFFAIIEKNRNKGYGSKILSSLIDEYKNHNFLLLIEEVNEKYDDYSNRLKRAKFYQDNGLLLSDIIVHEYGVDYQLVSNNINIEKENFFSIIRYHLGDDFYFNHYLKNAY